MKIPCFVCCILALVFATRMSAKAKIKIGVVPSEYTPHNRPTQAEPVSLLSFHFEIAETGRARVVVDYSYPDAVIYGRDDVGGGPRPTIAQVPGLKYDAAAHAVVYEADGERTVCAVVTQQSGFWGHRLQIKNTGACTVTTALAEHADDDGWKIRRFRAIDTYLKVN